MRQPEFCNIGRTAIFLEHLGGAEQFRQVLRSAGMEGLAFRKHLKNPQQVLPESSKRYLLVVSVLSLCVIRHITNRGYFRHSVFKRGFNTLLQSNAYR